MLSANPVDHHLTEPSNDKPPLLVSYRYHRTPQTSVTYRSPKTKTVKKNSQQMMPHPVLSARQDKTPPQSQPQQLRPSTEHKSAPYRPPTQTGIATDTRPL